MVVFCGIRGEHLLGDKCVCLSAERKVDGVMLEISYCQNFISKHTRKIAYNADG